MDGTITSDCAEISKIVEDYYANLYKPIVSEPLPDPKDPSAKLAKHLTQDLPDFSLYEIKNALKQMKNEKVPGQNGVTSELLKYGGKPVLMRLQLLFNKGIHEGVSPKS